MDDDDVRFELYLDRLVEETMSSLLEASDQEIEEELRAEGRDPDASAERMRAVLLEIADGARESHYARKERLRRAREAREKATRADGGGD